jgi:ribosomal protein S18 acetylase RimI-like enzyme
LLEIGRLPADRWEDYRDLRLEALGSEPRAFGSSPEDETSLTEGEWKRRIGSTLFALQAGKPIGMIVILFNDRPKTRHVANVFGFYVSRGHRGKGIGTKLLDGALRLAREDGRIVKVSLTVNPEQRAAVELYKRAGFVVVGRMRDELKVGRRFFDELMMEKLF